MSAFKGAFSLILGAGIFLTMLTNTSSIFKPSFALIKGASSQGRPISSSISFLVAIASVLAMDTQVLILDEPTIGQDKKGKEIIGNIILNLKKSGKTVISILHDMDFVAAYFDRVVVMKKGRIIASGTRETVFAQNDILEEAFIEQPYLSKLCNLLGLSNLYFSMEDLPK